MKIAVYCSSAENLPESWVECARVVGRWIASHGAQLVYGGVDAGLMKVTAQACKESGGKTVGVVPQRRMSKKSPLNDMYIPTTDLNERKSIMQLLADAFVVLPGGYGTLDEFATAFSYINFTGQQKKRIIIFNPNGLYDHLLAQLDVMIERGLMSADRLEHIMAVNRVEDIETALDLFAKNF